MDLLAYNMYIVIKYCYSTSARSRAVYVVIVKSSVGNIIYLYFLVCNMTCNATYLNQFNKKLT